MTLMKAIERFLSASDVYHSFSATTMIFRDEVQLERHRAMLREIGNLRRAFEAEKRRHGKRAAENRRKTGKDGGAR